MGGRLVGGGGPRGEDKERGELYVPQELLLQVSLCRQVTEHAWLQCSQSWLSMCSRFFAGIFRHLIYCSRLLLQSWLLNFKWIHSSSFGCWAGPHPPTIYSTWFATNILWLCLTLWGFQNSKFPDQKKLRFFWKRVGGLTYSKRVLSQKTGDFGLFLPKRGVI